jgi:hypothetical protein
MRRLSVPPSTTDIPTPHYLLMILPALHGMPAIPELERALTALCCKHTSGASYEVPSPAIRGSALHDLVILCATAGRTVWLYGEAVQPVNSSGVYARLVDRSEHYAQELVTWREGRGELPLPAACELIRLS